MLLKSTNGQTFDMRKFGCVLHNNTNVFICVDPSQTLFIIAKLATTEQAVALYDAIVKNWAFGEYVFDVPAWIVSNCRD